MGRASTKSNKNRYQLVREELGLSREKASELLEAVTPERIEKIESGKSLPHPDEVLTMAAKYRPPCAITTAPTSAPSGRRMCRRSR